MKVKVFFFNARQIQVTFRSASVTTKPWVGWGEEVVPVRAVKAERKGADHPHPAPNLESKAEPLLPLYLCGMLLGNLTFYYYYYNNADDNNTQVIKC